MRLDQPKWTTGLERKDSGKMTGHLPLPDDMENHGIAERDGPLIETTQGEEEMEKCSHHEESNAVSIPSLRARIEEKRETLHGPANPSDSVRFHVEGDTVEAVYFEHHGKLTGIHRDMGHAGEIVNQWFVCAASALGQTRKSGLWNFSIPLHILQSVKKEAVPCGVMVLLDIMAESTVPHWASPPPPSGVDSWKKHRRFMEAARQRELERSMPPALAEASKRAREKADLWTFHEEHLDAIKARKEYEEKRLGEALNSQRLSNRSVAEATLAWLIGKQDIPTEYTMDQLVQAVLYLMVIDSSQAKKIAEILDRWMVWSQTGGMNRSEISFLQENKESFCYASSLVCIIEDVSNSEGQVSTDMQECLKVWKKVRLG
jgi:hypothetical protein